MVGFTRAEPTLDEQPARCSLEGGGVYIDINSGALELDYEGTALLMRLGESGGLTLLGFDRSQPYRDLGTFYFSDEVFCTADLIDLGFDLAGTPQAEIILGTSASDRIRAAQGNDTLDGAEGDDRYYYERGDGIDCIQDSAGRTAIVFGENIRPENLMISSVTTAPDSALFLRMNPTQGHPASEGLDVRANPSSLSFQFADGSAFTWDELQTAAMRERLDSRALGSERACHIDIASAERAGLRNQRRQPHP
jgi:hypothetical protein